MAAFFCFLPTVEIRPFPTRKKKTKQKINEKWKIRRDKEEPTMSLEIGMMKKQVPLSFQKIWSSCFRAKFEKKKATKEKQIRAKFTCL